MRDVGYNNNVRYLFYGTRVRIYPTYIKTEDLTMDETCVKICLLCFWRMTFCFLRIPTWKSQWGSWIYIELDVNISSCIFEKHVTRLILNAETPQLSTSRMRTKAIIKDESENRELPFHRYFQICSPIRSCITDILIGIFASSD